MIKELPKEVLQIHRMIHAFHRTPSHRQLQIATTGMYYDSVLTQGANVTANYTLHKVQRSQERESQSWTEAETNHFPGCRRSEKGQRTEGPRASDIRTGESS